MSGKSIRSILVAGFAAASLMTFTSPVYAATAEDSSAQGQQQGWCNLVPTFCDNHNCGGSTARCNPCKPVTVKGVRNEQQGCGVRNRE